MAEDGIDIWRAVPKLLEPSLIQRADRIITMGCDVEDIQKIDEDWGLPDPKGQCLERVRDIREMVKAKVKGLIDDLAAQDSLISNRR